MDGHFQHAPVSRFLTVALPLSLVLALIAPRDFVTSHFGLVGAHVISGHGNFWSAVTHPLVEESPLLIFVAGVLIALWGPAVEISFAHNAEAVARARQQAALQAQEAGADQRAASGRQSATPPSTAMVFLFLVPAVAMALVCVCVGAALTAIDVFVFYRGYYGPLASIVAALAVARSHAAPNDPAFSFGVLRGVRASRAPFVVFSAAALYDVASAAGVVGDGSSAELNALLQRGGGGEGVEDILAAAVERGIVPRGALLWPALLAAWAAWAWLRFVRETAVATGSAASGTLRVRVVAGDPSPRFAFAEVFGGGAPPLQALLARVGAACFPLARLLGCGADVAAGSSAAADEFYAAAAEEEGRAPSLAASARQAAAAAAVFDPAAYFRATTAAAAAGGGSSATAAATTAPVAALQPLPGTTLADADRRRAMALAALTARLQQAQKASTSTPAAAGAPVELDFGDGVTAAAPTPPPQQPPAVLPP